MAVNTDEVSTKKGKKAKVHLVDIVQHGQQLIVPDGLSHRDAIKVLERQIVHDEQTVAVREEFYAFPYDGAVALQKALKEMFGWVGMIPTPSFWGERPPAMITVEVGHGQTIQVPWGRMSIPQLSGYLQTDAQRNQEGRFVFYVIGEVKRKYEAAVKDIGQLVRKYLREESIYRGKAVRVRFHDENGNAIAHPVPKFLDLTRTDENELIFASDVDSAVRTSLFTPIEHTEICRQHGIPLKRGVLLAGPFGVGKTLAAYVTAQKCERNGWTFIYCEDADELSDSMRFAQQYAPGVVFCEDIDRIMTGDRTAEMNQLLNVIDGIDAKDNDLMVVLTTNDVESINQALLRPGRLDAVINISTPDADATRRLVRLYGRGLVDPDDPLVESSKALANNIPAVIREAVERSKLSAIRLANGNGEKLSVSDPALVDAAITMKMHTDLLRAKVPDARSDIEKAAAIVAAKLGSNNNVEEVVKA